MLREACFQCKVTRMHADHTCVQKLRQVWQALQSCILGFPAALHQGTEQPEVRLQPGVGLLAVCTSLTFHVAASPDWL